MPRFVILHHDWPAPHYDLMLESGGVLRTWRLADPYGSDAEPIGDHRLEYLDYEGPVSGDRGHVQRWDHGTFELHFDTENGFSATFHGEKLIGDFALMRVPRGWTFGEV